MTTRWMASVARRLAPPPAGSDADLLARFAEARDPGAFAALVARHGAAVYGVCRARLANAADADDAFQVVFYVLARDAHRVRDRESVAGWLMRVAQLTALKVRRHHARHPAAELPGDAVAAQLPDDAAAREERAIVAEELAALPDKFRSVLVLCAVEGCSNTEAAEALGCPRGTVDSRLAAAKAKLRQRLLRRGIGLTALAGFEAALPQLGAGAGGWPALADGSWLTAIQYGTGASPPTTLTLLADGVSTAMTTTTKLVATALLAGGLLTTAGFGLTQGVGGDGPPAAATKAAPPAKADTPAKPDAPKSPDVAIAAMSDQKVRNALVKPIESMAIEGVSLEALLAQLEDKHGIVVRFDLAAYKRLRSTDLDEQGVIPSAELLKRLYEMKLAGRFSARVPVADLLTDICAQLPGRHTFRIRNGEVLIGPAFIPPAIPGRTGDREGQQNIEWQRLLEQIHGQPVSLAIEEKPFQDAIKELRRQTGANIVVSITSDRFKDKSLLVSATFDDVRLYTALEILGDMVELKLVYINNVYYLTLPANAERLQKKVNEELFGREQKPLAVPAGYLTDGINLYVNPGNLKPEVNNGSFGGGLGIIPGVEPAAPVPAAAPKK